MFENPFTKRITADKRAPSANPFSFSDRECNEHFQTLVFVKIFPYGTLQHVLTALGIWHLRFNCLQHSVYACDVATFLASPCSPVFELSIKNFLARPPLPMCSSGFAAIELLLRVTPILLRFRLPHARPSCMLP